jgi:hypothetical protein
MVLAVSRCTGGGSPVPALDNVMQYGMEWSRRDGILEVVLDNIGYK